MSQPCTPDCSTAPRQMSVSELESVYRTLTLQRNAGADGADSQGRSIADLDHLRAEAAAEYRRRASSNSGGPGSALVIGFVGRYNSGDELMLEMHLDLLRSLGFDDIDVWTELPERESHYHHLLHWNPRKAYGLVVLGGGGLDVGYGFYPAVLAKLRYDARVICSSINLPSHDERYLNVLRLVTDCVITRNQAECQRLRSVLPQLFFLPDISTLYCAPPSVRSGRVAMVIRDGQGTIVNFTPDLPTDVLVLSRADASVSKSYASKFGCRLISLWHRDPREHVRVLAGYEKVISIGRFHAALYAAGHGCQYAFLYSAYHKPLPDEIRYVFGRLSWAQIQEVASHHVVESKIGLPSNRFATYGKANSEEYRRLFRRALGTLAD